MVVRMTDLTMPLMMFAQVTNEPPAGLKAGILRSYTVIVDQDRLERVESMQWRQLLFALCFLHSTVQVLLHQIAHYICRVYMYTTSFIEYICVYIEDQVLLHHLIYRVYMCI